MGNDTVKEDDKAVLLEGGGLQSASPRAKSSPASSPIFRFVKANAHFFEGLSLDCFL